MYCCAPIAWSHRQVDLKRVLFNKLHTTAHAFVDPKIVMCLMSIPTRRDSGRAHRHWRLCLIIIASSTANCVRVLQSLAFDVLNRLRYPLSSNLDYTTLPSAERGGHSDHALFHATCITNVHKETPAAALVSRDISYTSSLHYDKSLGPFLPCFSSRTAASLLLCIVIYKWEQLAGCTNVFVRSPFTILPSFFS
jgi:hypothetical protein